MILEGEYKDGDKFPSIRVLSEKYGINKTTVNTVISNLATEGFLRVEQGKGAFVAKKDIHEKKHKKVIGVMLVDFNNDENAEAVLLGSIQENLKDDYFIVPFNSYNDTEIFYKGLKGFIELNVDGMIILPPPSESYDADIIRDIIGNDIPLVFINRKVQGLVTDFVFVDFEIGMYNVTKYLLSRNKKNIVLLGHDSPSIANMMFSGYKKAHVEMGIPVNESLLVDWESIVDDYANMVKMIEVADGIIASDYLIYKHRNGIYSSGKKIPGDLSIIGINDSGYSRFMTPPLTALRFPSEKIGAEVTKMIIGKIENKVFNESVVSIIPELVIRKS
jgi:Transcriptional regulators